MSVKNATLYKTYKLPFKNGEEERLNKYLEETGRKAGPYLRVLVLKEVKRWESNQDDEVIELKR